VKEECWRKNPCCHLIVKGGREDLREETKRGTVTQGIAKPMCGDLREETPSKKGIFERGRNN